MHMANEQYQQNSHKAQVKDFDSWASRLWRGTSNELVFKSLDCFTVRPIFSTRPITRIKSFFFFFWGGGGGGGGGGVLSSNAFTIWCCIQISRPPRVIRRFERRSCFLSHWQLLLHDAHRWKLMFFESPFLFSYNVITHKLFYANRLNGDSVCMTRVWNGMINRNLKQCSQTVVDLN